jgi:O-antigen ligase
MGVEVAKPLELRRRPGKPQPQVEVAKPALSFTSNALLGMGLWVLLWSGYNTDLERFLRPEFPTDTLDFIHGLRAFGPILAGWIACLVIFVRAKRLFPWIIGPVGLLFFYAATGLVSSATLSVEPAGALYFGFNYLAIVLVMLAIALVDDPLPDLLKVLRLTWFVAIALTLGLLGAIPILGSDVIIQTEASPVGIRAYTGVGSVMGMTSTRNTGFARYAAVSALAALPTVMNKENRLVVRIFWGVMLAASFYALILANGRTETAAFIAGLFVFLIAEKARRLLYSLAAAAAAIVLGFEGFYSKFYLYFTRSGHFDLTFTRRTDIWQEGWQLFWKSPWVGFGFQADRYFMEGLHMHNAFLHALVQSGFLGGVAIFIGLAIVWYYTIYYFFLHQPADKSLIPPEIPAILLFTTVSSITESTFAYYSAAWLLCAPTVVYVMSLHARMRKVSLKATQDRQQKLRLAKRKPRVVLPPFETPPA